MYGSHRDFIKLRHRKNVEVMLTFSYPSTAISSIKLRKFHLRHVWWSPHVHVLLVAVSPCVFLIIVLPSSQILMYVRSLHIRIIITSHKSFIVLNITEPPCRFFPMKKVTLLRRSNMINRLLMIRASFDNRILSLGIQFLQNLHHHSLILFKSNVHDLPHLFMTRSQFSNILIHLCNFLHRRLTKLQPFFTGFEVYRRDLKYVIMGKWEHPLEIQANKIPVMPISSRQSEKSQLRRAMDLYKWWASLNLIFLRTWLMQWSQKFRSFKNDLRQ